MDKERIVNAYENGENIPNFSRMLGIKEKSASSIIFRYSKSGTVTTGQRGGHRKAMITEEVGQALLTFLDGNYTATLAAMKIFLSEKHGVSPSLSTISSYLRNKHITQKKLRYTVVGKNSDRVKQIRQEYVDRYMTERFKSSQCIYIDETSINIWMHRTMARSQREQRVCVYSRKSY
mgnify:CR=1 FL=1